MPASRDTIEATSVGRPMPRLTRSPGRSSCATRMAIKVRSSIASLPGDQVVDQYGRRHHFIRSYDSNWNDFAGLGHHHVGSHGHQGIKIARGHAVSQVANMVGAARVEERELGSQRHIQQIHVAVNFEGSLTLRNCCAHAGRSQHAAETVSTGANSLGERSLWNEFDLEFSG